MKNNLLRQLLTFLLMAGCSSFLLQGQTNQDFFAQLQEEEQIAIEALVLYPPSTRANILEAVLYPEVLVKLQRIQEKTSASFQDFMNEYPREVQEVIWDLSRYPTRNPTNFKEYGEFEYDLQRYNQRNPGKELSAGKYLERNTRSYETLRATAPSRSPVGKEQERPVPSTQRPANVAPKTNPTSVDRSLPPAASPTKQAEEYHRNTWEQPKNEAPRPSQAPAERIERRPSPVPSAPRTTQPAPSRPTKQSPAPVRKPTTDKPRKSGGGG